MRDVSFISFFRINPPILTKTLTNALTYDIMKVAWKLTSKLYRKNPITFLYHAYRWR